MFEHCKADEKISGKQRHHLWRIRKEGSSPPFGFVKAKETKALSLAQQDSHL